MEHHAQQHRVTLSDGRVLAGTSLGPIDGRPVLFVAGAATGKSMAFGEEVLGDIGVRLITMDRPGIGDSSPADARTIESTASDYRAYVAGVLGANAGPIPVVANSQGAIFGLALALAGAAERLVLVSPADELQHPDVHALLPAEATGLSDLAEANPGEAAAVLAGFSAQAMEEMVLGGSHESDRAFYSSPDFLPQYRAALAEGFANGGVGYVRDTVLAMRAWGLPLDRIACPVQVWFGTHDLSHSPDHGEILTARIPDATREIREDAGGALLWTHAREVLAAALAQ